MNDLEHYTIVSAKNRPRVWLHLHGECRLQNLGLVLLQRVCESSMFKQQSKKDLEIKGLERQPSTAGPC